MDDNLCDCGCGEEAGYYKSTNYDTGAVEGEPKDYKHGHNSRDKNPMDYDGAVEKWKDSYDGKSEEWRQAMEGNNFAEGNEPWNKGKSGYSVHTEESIEKIKEKNSGKNNHFYGESHSKETREMISNALEGRTRTKEARKKQGESIRGENHYNWQGGKTEIKHRLRESGEYHAWRRKVFERDNRKCQECGAEDTELHAHHIKRFSDLLDEVVEEFGELTFKNALSYESLWGVQNGKTLCKECHGKAHGFVW